MQAMKYVASRVPLAACVGDAVIKGESKTKPKSVHIELFEDGFSCNQKHYAYSDISDLAIHNSTSSFNIIYNEWSSSLHYRTINGDQQYAVARCAWFKSQSVEDMQRVGQTLQEKSFQIRLNRILSEIDEVGYYVIPLEPWAVITDSEGVDAWKAASNQVEPLKERQIRITNDWYLERGDGYRVSIPESGKAGRLWLGTRTTGYGVVKFSSSPEKIVASNDELNSTTANKIVFTLTFNGDVVRHLLDWVAANK